MRIRVCTTQRQRLLVLLVPILMPAVVLVIINPFVARTGGRIDVHQKPNRLARLAATVESGGGAHVRVRVVPDADRRCCSGYQERLPNVR